MTQYTYPQKLRSVVDVAIGTYLEDYEAFVSSTNRHIHGYANMQRTITMVLKNDYPVHVVKALQEANQCAQRAYDIAKLLPHDGDEHALAEFERMKRLVFMFYWWAEQALKMIQRENDGIADENVCPECQTELTLTMEKDNGR